MDDVICMDVSQSTAQVFHPTMCFNNVHVVVILHMSEQVIVITQLLNEYDLGLITPSCIAAKLNVK